MTPRRPEIAERICKFCNESYKPWRYDQVACSRKCSVENKLCSPEQMRRDFIYRITFKYGLTFEMFCQMVIDQTGRCALCEEQFEGKDEPHVDHDHETKKIRGLLCNSCNVSKVGSHNLKSALALVEYMRRWET